MADPARTDLSSARIVLLGTGTHDPGSDLPDISAVADTLADLRVALSERCGVADGRISTVLDAPSPMEMGDAVAQAMTDADDLLVLYYVGHGLIGETGTLRLACRASPATGDLDHRSLAYGTVRRYLANYLSNGPGRSVVVVLDCCFSGRVVGSLGDVGDLAAVSGGFVLTSAGRYELAMAPRGERHTAFSGALLRLLRTGDATLPADISLLDAVRYLTRELPEAGFPRPRCRADGLAGTRILTTNPMVPRPIVDPGIRRPGPGSHDRAPYRGLTGFDTSDAAWFFGRDRDVTTLIEAMSRRYDDPAPLLVLGASGAGKSSLLRAGLVPALSHGELPVPGSARWPCRVCVPDDAPFTALAEALAPVLRQPAEELSIAFAQKESALAEALAGRVDPAERIVLVVDQFEQVYTACQDENDRNRFISALCAAATAERPRILLVLGVRADFYGRCAEHAGLAAALREHVVVGPLRVGELRDVIERPAALAGLDVAAGLVDLLLADLGVHLPFAEDDPAPYEPGRLPLLSHALLSTWRTAADGPLTIEGYQATGGIGGALAHTADQALANLALISPHAPDLARRVLLRLVRVGDGSDDTRRRVSRAQLVAEFPDAGVLDVVLATLTAADTRLLTADEDTVQLAHEALISAWPTLHGWLAGDRAGVLAAQQLADAAERWAADGEDPGQLYQGVRLELAESLLDDTELHDGAGLMSRPYIGALSRRFLAASKASRDTARRVARSRRRRGRVAVAVIAVLLLVAGVAVTATVTSSRQRDAQQLLVTARTVLAAADARRTDHPVDALRWGITGAGLANSAADAQTTKAAHDGLVNTIAGSWYYGALHTTGDLAGIDTGPDDWLLTLTGRGQVGLWDTSTVGSARSVPLGSVGGPVSQAVFLPTRHLLITVAVAGPLTVWSLADRHTPHQLGSTAAGPVPITAIRSTQDGTRLVTGDDKGSVAVWNLADPYNPFRQGTASPPCAPHCHPIQDIAIRPDGTSMVSVDRNVATTWFIPRSGDPHRGPDLQLPALESVAPNTRSFDHRSIRPVLDTRIATSIRPDGAAVAVGGSAGTDTAAALLTGAPDQPDPAAADHLRTLAPLPGHELHVDEMQFSHDGTEVATVGADRSVRLWDVTDPAHPVLRRQLADQLGPIAGLAFSTGDDMLLLATQDGTVAEYLTHGLVIPNGPVSAPAGQRLVWVDPEQGELMTKKVSDTGIVAIGDPVGHLLVIGTAAGDSSTTTTSGGVLSYIPSDAGDGTVSMWRLGAELSATRLDTIDHQHTPTALALGPADHLLVVGNGVGGITLWDLTQPNTHHLLAAMENTALGIGTVEITSAAVSQDGHNLAVGTAGSGVLLLDISRAANPVVRARLTEPTGSVHGLVFSPDGSTLTAGSSDGVLRFWDTRGRPTLAAAKPNSAGPVVAAAYDPNTPLLATGAADGSVTLWDATDPRQPIALQTVPGPSQGAAVVQFTPDGTGLIATDGYRTLSRWSVRIAVALARDPVQVACGLVGDGLTKAEWEADPYLSKYSYRPLC